MYQIVVFVFCQANFLSFPFTQDCVFTVGSKNMLIFRGIFISVTNPGMFYESIYFDPYSRFSKSFPFPDLK